MFIRFKLLLPVLMLFISVSCGKGDNGGNPVIPPVTQPPNTFANPLLPSGPDPWIIKKDSFYYYTHTLGNRIAVWRTKKVSELTLVPMQTIWSAPATGPDSKNVWAPELHFLNNVWY